MAKSPKSALGSHGYSRPGLDLDSRAGDRVFSYPSGAEDITKFVPGFEVRPGPKPRLICNKPKCGKPARYRNSGTGCFILSCECTL